MNKMKMKSVVFASAVIAAASLFATGETVTSTQFTVSPSVKEFDTAPTSPVVVTNTTLPTDSTTGAITSYSITAYITNLIIHASTTPEYAGTVDALDAKGAIAAVDDSGVKKWVGLVKEEATIKWVELTGVKTPVENSAYVLTMVFDNSAKVLYKIDGEAATNGELDAPAIFTQVPTRFAFAGVGACTNVVGEYTVTLTGNYEGVTVNDGAADEGTIIIDTSKLSAADVEATADNGLKYWVNYVLGISENGTADEDSKPFAAPVQNASSNTLTFKLGGVHALGQDETGAKVTYTVEALETPSPAASGTPTTLNNEPNGYVGPNDPVTVDLPSSGVKYYRIKIKIDPAH